MTERIQTNEYKESLRLYAKLQSEHRTLMKKGAKGERNEEDCIAFLLRMNEYWPKILAMEHHSELHALLFYYASVIDGFRIGTGRDSVWASENYMEIFEQERNRPKGLAVDLLDDRIHQDKPILLIKDLEEMANAIEKHELEKLGNKA